MIELLQGVLVIASFIGALYAPFHYLDHIASPEAKAKARAAIEAGQSNTDTKPLVSLLETVFGPKHLTLRCFALSSVMSLVFTALFLVMANKYVLPFAPYFEDYRARIPAAEEKLKEALTLLIEVHDLLINALEKADHAESRSQLEELRRKKQELQRMRDTPYTKQGMSLLLWMVLSVAISMNLLCDYVALGKTRIILKKISATESPWVIGAYLFIDLFLAVVIWIVSVAIFLVINTEPFLVWAKETPSLVSVVGMVSLASTVATSIWIYTFFAGTLSRRFIGVLLRGTTWLVNPEEHTFKVIGIAGSVAMAVLLVVSFLIYKWAG